MTAEKWKVIIQNGTDEVEFWMWKWPDVWKWLKKILFDRIMAEIQYYTKCD